MNEVLIHADYKDCYLLRLARHFDTSFHIENIMPSRLPGHIGTALFHFTENESTFNRILDHIDSTDNVPFTIIEKDNPSKEKYLLYVEMLRSCGCTGFSESGCFLKKNMITPKGMYVDILTGGEGKLAYLIEKMSQKGFEIDIIKKRNIQDEWDLTSRQKNILQKAFDLGYFDVPKKISLKELSKEMDVSPSSIDEILKRAKKKIISHYLMR